MHAYIHTYVHTYMYIRTYIYIYVYIAGKPNNPLQAVAPQATMTRALTQEAVVFATTFYEGLFGLPGR